MASQSLQSFTSLLETPYISTTFGGNTFGLTRAINPVTGVRNVRGLNSLTVNKLASGTVNTYTATLDYVIEPGADPNYIDRIISSDTSRNIYFEYGDLSQPSFSYKKERAIIANIVPKVSSKNAKISYQIDATSSVALNYVIKRNYPNRKGKPSKLIFELLYTESNGLLELFPGMADRAKVEKMGWIAQNDIEVQIDEKINISPLDYLRFLVSNMISTSESFYGMVIHDRDGEVENGFWFEVVCSSLRPSAYELEVDVGYPGQIPVFDFQVQDNTSYALITKYQNKVDTHSVININKFGEEIISADPSFVVRNGQANSVLRAWWKSMTSFPINATLTVRGLIVPAILCENIKINVLFFGRKYNYSGKYMVVSQTDQISSSGYRTVLGLVRVGGEDVL